MMMMIDDAQKQKPDKPKLIPIQISTGRAAIDYRITNVSTTLLARA